MRAVFADPAMAAPRARKAAQDMRERHSAHAVGTAMRRRLAAIDPHLTGAAPQAGAFPSASALPALLSNAQRLVDQRGRPDQASRHGRFGTLARRSVLRLIRPHTAYQLELNDALAQALTWLNEQAGAQDAETAAAAAHAAAELAKAQALLGAQIRRQQRELADVVQGRADG